MAARVKAYCTFITDIAPGRPDLWRILAPRMERVALADPEGAAPSTAKKAVFPDTLEAVFAASRLKSATRAQQRADSPLIAPNGSDRDPLRHVQHLPPTVS